MRKLNDALNLARNGQVEAAISVLSEIVTSGDTSVMGHRAYLFKQLGRLEEAVADYDRLLAAHPDDDEAGRQRADALRQNGRSLDAARDLLSLLNKNPLDHTAAQLLLRCQEACGAANLPPPALPTDGFDAPVQPINSVLQAIEREPGSYPTSSFPEVGRMLYTITRCLRPAIAVETGCYIGYSSICIGQAMEDNGGGHLHSFDLFPDDSPIVSAVVGQCQTTFQAARMHVERANLTHRITLHRGDSPTTIEAFFRAHMPSGPIVDLAFIDGDHTIRGCQKDFHAVDPLLKPGGIILLHDTVPDRCGWAGPRNLLEQLPEKSRGQYQCINLPSPEGFGLGLLQKTGGAVVGKWHPSLAAMIAERLLHSSKYR